MRGFCAALVLLAALLAAPAWAQGNVIESYSAFLSTADHYNSKGARLTQPWQIIRQDRANFHRFNLRDDWDDWDELFDNANNRAKLEQTWSSRSSFRSATAASSSTTKSSST